MDATSHCRTHRETPGVALTLQGVGKYLRRWGLTPQKPARHSREQDPKEVREFMEQTLPDAQEQAEEEGATLHVLDEVGAQAQDQIGTSYAPAGETPVQTIPKTHIEQNVISGYPLKAGHSVTFHHQTHFFC